MRASVESARRLNIARRATIAKRAINVGDTFARQNVPVSPNKIVSIPKVARTIPVKAEPVKISKVLPPPPEPDRRVFISIGQPPDYTAYPQGEKKIGLISQDGLAKRQADIQVVRNTMLKRGEQRRTVAMKGEGKRLDYTDYPGGYSRRGLISQEGLTKRNVDMSSQRKSITVIRSKNNPVVKAKVSSEGGFLYYVDNFFNWLNKVIGE